MRTCLDTDMRTAGDSAPGFELPAFVDGEITKQSLEEYVGDNVVVLAFYPADFNPACDEEGSDLGELDLFTMQKDVVILGISPDSVYSHRKFADVYDLKVPLLSDTRREVAEAYGVELDSEQGYLLKRAVFVIGLKGRIQYAWATDDAHELPTVEPIRAAISSVGGDSTAVSRYKVGHAHYVEGRRAFTSAMNAYGDQEWMTARKDFERAREEFEEAADEFDTALRFSDAPELDGPFEQARLKSNSLWQAADWLADSADAYSSGSGSIGSEYREDAERPLTSARNLDEPVDPSLITVEDGEVTLDIDDEESIMTAIREEQSSGDEDTEDPAGGVELSVEDVDPGPVGDEAEDDGEEDTPETDAARRAREFGGMDVEMGDSGGADEDQIADAVSDVSPDDEPDELEDTRTEEMDLEEETGEADQDETEEDVSDEEVAEITAELEQQSEDAEEPLGDDDTEDDDISDEEVAEIAAELQDQSEDED